MNENQTTELNIGAAIRVHNFLGPGLLESTYETCLLHELIELKLNVERQKALPVQYRDIKIDCGYRIDLLVNENVIVELKSCSSIEKIHEMQLLSYLRLSNLKVGLLINFNVVSLKQGLKRIVNQF